MSEAGEEGDEEEEERETASFGMVRSWDWAMKQVKRTTEERERERVLGDVEGSLDIDVDGGRRVRWSRGTGEGGVRGLRNGGEALVVRNQKGRPNDVKLSAIGD